MGKCQQYFSTFFTDLSNRDKFEAHWAVQNVQINCFWKPRLLTQAKSRKITDRFF